MNKRFMEKINHFLFQKFEIIKNKKAFVVLNYYKKLTVFKDSFTKVNHFLNTSSE